jgi:hypothetical protein
MDFSAWLVSFILPLGIATISVLFYFMTRESDNHED